jgi:hypothetical protein
MVAVRDEGLGSIEVRCRRESFFAEDAESSRVEYESNYVVFE